MTLFQVLDPTLAELDDAGIAQRLRAVLGRSRGRSSREYREVMPDATVPRALARRSRPTACSACPRSGSPRPSARTARCGCTASRGRRPCSAASCSSTHALEIPFVFDNLDQRGADKFTGDGPERAGDRRRDAPGVDRVRPRPATRAGPPTRRPAGRRCASTPTLAEVARRPRRRACAGPGTSPPAEPRRRLTGNRPG